MTLTEMMENKQLTRDDFQEIGQNLSAIVKDRIESENVKGPPLPERWLKYKREHGFFRNKLKMTGGLQNDITYSTNNKGVSIGNTNRKLSKMGSSERIAFSYLGKIHNEGLGNMPTREYVFINGQLFNEEQREIEKNILKVLGR